MNPALHNLCASYVKARGRKTCSHSSRAPPAAFAPQHLILQVFKAVTDWTFFASDK